MHMYIFTLNIVTSRGLSARPGRRCDNRHVALPEITDYWLLEKRIILVDEIIR